MIPIAGGCVIASVAKDEDGRSDDPTR